MTKTTRDCTVTNDAANAAADVAAKWVLAGGVVLAVLTAPALFGFVGPGNPMQLAGVIRLVALIYAVASGVCLAKHRAAAGCWHRFLLVPLTALLLACLPILIHWPGDTLLVLAQMLGLFVFPMLVDLALQRIPAAHICSVVVLVGAGCFALCGVSVGFPLILIPMFAVTAGFAIARCAATGQHAAGRLVFAATIGFGVAWLGLHLQCTSFHDSPAEYEQWLADYPADADPYQTFMVVGFPIPLIEGHGNGGGRGYLPWEKGLWVLLANYLICTGAAFLASRLIPARALIMATAAGIVFSVVAGFAGWSRLLDMLVD